LYPELGYTLNPMTLADYLAINAITEEEFESISGVSQTRINAIKNGEGTSAFTAFKIMRAAPEITLFDLVGDRRREDILRTRRART
jgi:hypothetical protein